MPSQIRPNRPEVSDRFPMLGFTIKTDGENKRYEVAIASDASLFRPDAKARRAPANFYSSRACGLQPIATGEAVYVLPPEVLARFVGQEKLYYALATYAGTNGASPDVVALPSEGSAYVNLRGLTGRSLQRVRVLPNRQRAAAGYGNGGGSQMEWGGDVTMPGTQPVTSTAPRSASPNSQASREAAATSPAPVDYRDGFGPMPPPAVTPATEPGQVQAAALSDDIPLDPGVGGMSISADALEIGDIIISTTGEFVSRAIRAASGSQVSHSLLYVGQGGQVIEAVGSGVRMIPLEEAIGPATLAVAVRIPGLTAEQRQQIADAAAGYIGRDYNYLGIVRQARFQLDNRVCSLLPESARGACRQWYGTIDLGTNNSSEFFCSELIISAYAAAGVPLTTTPPNWTTPEDLAEMFLRQGSLAYVGHLKAPPLVRGRSIFEVFGLGLGAGNDNRATSPRTSYAARRPAYAKGLTVARIPIEQAISVHMPPAREASTWERVAIEAALAVLAGPMAPTILALRTLASSQNYSIGIGPAAAVGFELGMGVGGGVIFAPGGRIGIYGQIDVRAGLIDSISAGLQVTIMRGGIESWNEVAFAVGGAFVEVVEATVQVLFNIEHGFRGVSLEVGVGLSIEPIEVFIAVEGTVSQQVAGAQGLGLGYRDSRVRARAQSNESFSINWDDLELIAQPTNSSCWATAGAMVIGWRDQVSISSETIAQIAGRTTRRGIYPNEHCPFGIDIGLVCEPPQSYTIDAFRGLLEDYGPLWVGIIASIGGHAIIVTGMYSDGAPDGSDTYLRIADPWDRVVGSPGSPGRYLSTHNTGSRYIMSWADFLQEYEGRATSEVDGTVNVQILHAASSAGRQPNRSGAVGYAQAIALDNVSFSINWDDLALIPQPTPLTGWAAAAAMVIDWRDQASHANPVQNVITMAGRGDTTPLVPSEHFQLALSVGLQSEMPRSYTYDEFHSLLQSFGPLWVSVQIGGPGGHGHSIVVTGMYSDGAPDGSDTFVRITDPWDRVVGTPGAPGAYAKTNSTGSRYIMSWPDFNRQFEDRRGLAGGTTNVLIMHAADTGGRQPRIQTGPAAGYAQAAALSGTGAGTKLPRPPTSIVAARAMDGGAVEIATVIAGAAMEKLISHDGNITWELERLRGMKHPNDTAPSPAPSFRDAPTIRLDDWPYLDAVDTDRLAAWFSVDWQFNGVSLGNVRIDNIGTNGALLRGLHVDARIMDDNILYPPANPTRAALRIRFNYRFTRAIGSDYIAITDLHLYGDGTFDKTSRWEQS